MPTQRIFISEIILEWSNWYPWDYFKRDARSNPEAISVPQKSGVYEVKYADQDHRLTIGKAANLRKRIKQALVKGTSKHSSGKRIRQNEDVSQIVIRWATTDRPSAVEEELHKLYVEQFGKLPQHTKRT